MYLKLDSLEKYKDLGVFLIRIAFGFRLIYGTIDNVLSNEQMLHFAEFLKGHGFPLPLLCAYISVVFQFLAGFSFLSGLWIRFFSLIMALNFAIAIVMVHIGDSYLNTAPAIHLLVVSVFLLLNGSGSWVVWQPKKRKATKKKK